MMNITAVQRLFPGNFNFFRVTPEDLELAIPDSEAVLPQPQRIFLESEEATPLLGFPVLINETSTALRDSLEGYLDAEAVTVLAELATRRMIEAADSGSNEGGLK